MENVTYENHLGCWVIWDNDISKAEQVKRLHPEDNVMLYNPETGEKTRYIIEIEMRRPHMHAGKFIHKDKEKIEV